MFHNGADEGVESHPTHRDSYSRSQTPLSLAPDLGLRLVHTLSSRPPLSLASDLGLRLVRKMPRESNFTLARVSDDLVL